MEQRRRVCHDATLQLRTKHTAHLPESVLVRDLAPYLLPILAPAIRPVSPELLKAHEKQALARLIETLLDYGLSFVLHQNETTFEYVMQPYAALG
jgi:hypothetical protein